MSLNLLPSQAKFQVEKIRAASLSKKILTSFLVVWVVLVLIVFFVRQVELWLVTKQNDKYKSLVASYLESSDEIVTSQIIKFRTKLLGKVLTDRFEYSNAFNVVGNIFDPQIIINDFELKEKTFFEMTVEAGSPELMKSIESRVSQINLGASPEVKRIVIKSATYSKTLLKWVVALEVYIK
ncbi:MAG: hypothetical protein WC069_01300 [Candidatus Shapirobacteria bacterium]